MSRESIVICTYGPSGVGKTTDQGYSFPRALFIAAPGALNSITHVCGYTPANTFIRTIPEVTKLIKDAGKQYKSVVIDDFSFLAEQTLSTLEKKHKGFLLWGALRDTALEFRDTARFAGVDVIINCWEQPPKLKDAVKLRGGPMLPGKLPEQIPALCDVVLRASHDAQRKPWPSVYRCQNDPSFIMKDRFNVASVCDPAPMNLAELLRAANIKVERHEDLPDQEDIVETIAASLKSAPVEEHNSIVNAYYKQLVGGGVNVTVARWTLRDALDRSVIRNALSVAADSFIPITNALG